MILPRKWDADDADYAENADKTRTNIRVVPETAGHAIRDICVVRVPVSLPVPKGGCALVPRPT